MPKDEQTTEEKIQVAVDEVRNAMLDNVKASKAVVDATIRKQQSKYKLSEAKKRLASLEKELIEL